MNAPRTFPESVPQGHSDRLTDARRLTALEDTRLLDSLPEPSFDRLVKLAKRLTGSAIGLFSLIDDERQYFKARDGLPPQFAGIRETPLTHSLCQYVVSTAETLCVEDARVHPLLKSNPAATELSLVSYLGVPVRSVDGQTLGSFCVIDTHPRAWSPADHEAMNDLAGCVEMELMLRHVASARQLLVRDLNHHVSMLISVISRTINVNARSTTEVARMGDTLRSRLHALSKTHDLIRPAVEHAKVQHLDVSLQTLLSVLLEPHLAMETGRLTLEGPPVSLGIHGATGLATILYELANNAARHGALTDPEGGVHVKCLERGGQLELHWIEIGGPKLIGGPNEQGFGQKLISLTVETHLGGNYEIDWHPDGVRWSFGIPLEKLGSHACT